MNDRRFRFVTDLPLLTRLYATYFQSLIRCFQTSHDAPAIRQLDRRPIRKAGRPLARRGRVRLDGLRVGRDRQARDNVGCGERPQRLGGERPTDQTWLDGAAPYQTSP